MNAKWYGIVAEIIQAVPKDAWNDKSLEEMLVLLCDAQVEAGTENTDSNDLMQEIVANVIGADEPGRR